MSLESSGRREAIRKGGAATTGLLGLLGLPLTPPAQAEILPTLEERAKLAQQKLSRVPVFTVTTSDGDTPFFTSTDKAGTPVGYFYTERADAEAALTQVRKKDPTAIVTAVPLDQAWTLTRQEDWAVNGGKFKFQATRRQIVNANGNAGRDLKLEKDGKIPLFFDRRVTLAQQDAFPLFFKFEELQKVYDKGVGRLPADTKGSAGGLQVQITTVDEAVESIKQGVAETDKLILLTSESF